MKAKKYLGQLKKMELIIFQKQKEYNALQGRRTVIGTLDYTKERVQTSSDGSSFTEVSNKVIDLQNEILCKINELCDIRHEITAQIHQLSDIRYIDILFAHYVEYKTFEEIAEEMHLSYHWVCHLHGDALKEFENTFLKKK